MSHSASLHAATCSAFTGLKALTAGLILASLAACSSGDGGKDVTIGSGQTQGGGANGASGGGDPIAVDYPVFYVKRPVPDPDDNAPINDARNLVRFETGADLYTRPSASPSAQETNLTAAETQGKGDIRDVDVNFDGSKVVFSMRAQFIENADEEDQPTWNIWEYDTKSKVLRRIITSNTIEEEGQDIMPHYLPDGRIVFSSTRQRQSRAILLDENKPQYAAQVENPVQGEQPAFNLHVMDADGTNINQISFNQAHDLDPAIMNDGRIVYTRWESAIDDSQFDLYSIKPDGSDLQLLYGANSHNTGTVNPDTGNPTTIQFLNPRPMADNRTLAIIRPFTGTSEGGDLVLIDSTNYVDCNQTVPTTAVNTSTVCNAQSRALPTIVKTIPGPSPGGRYRSAAPLFDGTNRLLVSWSQCRLMDGTRIVPCTNDRLADPDAVEAPPLYGVYIYDVRDNTQKPIVAPQEGFIFTEVVAGSARTLPPVILNRVAGVDYPQPLEAESVGILHIRSVYDFDGVDNAPGGITSVRDPGNAARYPTRPARFLRLEKVVSQPDEDTRDVPNFAFGPLGKRFGMRDILGYAPIEPDGSVKVKVPSNVAFAISVLDRDGKRIGGRHTNWLQVTTGETVQCNGCHTTTGTPRAHGRAGLFTSINAGAGTSGPFPNTNAALPANAGETMAETRGRIICGGACKPSVNLVFDDYWPAAGIAKEISYDACYVAGPSGVPADPAIPFNPAVPASQHACISGLTTTKPTSDQCISSWSGRCRVTINYEQEIHPLWKVDRRTFDVNGPDPTVVLSDNTCIRCHSEIDGANVVRVALGQLDLTDGPSDENPDQFRAYRELLFQDNEETLNNGAVVDAQYPVGVDPVTGLTIFDEAPVPASMSANGARASSRFFNEFAAGGGHEGYLSAAELKLLAEWLDIGAQYYNDPFLAPEN